MSREPNASPSSLDSTADVDFGLESCFNFVDLDSPSYNGYIATIGRPGTLQELGFESDCGYPETRNEQKHAHGKT